jgi:hypothetical protein
VKSALEIAMERAKELGKASPEEIRKNNEKEYAPVGHRTALAYIDGKYSLRDVEIALDKHKENREIVIRAMLKLLIESLDLENYKRVLEGIQLLASNREHIEETSKEIEMLCEEYENGKQRIFEEVKGGIERQEIEKLEKTDISGSAIGVEAEESDGWRKISNELHSNFGKGLFKLKGELRREIWGFWKI